MTELNFENLKQPKCPSSLVHTPDNQVAKCVNQNLVQTFKNYDLVQKKFTQQVH